MGSFVVTGAASGIGAATARTLRNGGADVIGVDRTASESVELVADLRTPAGVREVIDGLPDDLDGLCNCAGLPGTGDAATVMAVNVLATLTLADEVGARLAPGAAVVSVASLAGEGWRDRVQDISRYLQLAATGGADEWFRGQAALMADAYRFSKECVIYGSQALAARRIDSKVRYVTVSPGPVSTPILAIQADAG